MTGPENRDVEHRLLIIAAWLVTAGSAVTWALFDPVQAASFLCGGILAALNVLWLRRIMNSITLQDRKASKRHILAGFLIRLLLIPLCLYAMIRFLFFSLAAAVAGFAMCHCTILVEGVLEALNSSGKNARAK